VQRPAINDVKGGNQPVQRVDDPYHGRSDESRAAALTAARISSRHYPIYVTAQTFFDIGFSNRFEITRSLCCAYERILRDCKAPA
jgi:hypothetical protein